MWQILLMPLVGDDRIVGFQGVDVINGKNEEMNLIIETQMKQ